MTDPNPRPARSLAMAPRAGRRQGGLATLTTIVVYVAVSYALVTASAVLAPGLTAVALVFTALVGLFGVLLLYGSHPAVARGFGIGLVVAFGLPVLAVALVFALSAAGLLGTPAR